MTASTPAARRTLDNAPFLDAAAGRTPSRPPVWLMRQAGRSLPEYRAAREGISMLDSCFMPELLAEITLQPVRRHDVDAAILFSDIVVPLKAAGVNVLIPGHYATERPGIEDLAARLANQFPGVPCHASRRERDPLRSA